MRLIITRPSERAGHLKERLEELGFEVSLAPLLTISFQDFKVPETPLQGVIFTSVQGVEAAQTKESLKFFPAFAVGSKTAGAAAQAGFGKIYNADSDVEALFDLVVQTCNPAKGLLLHLAGDLTTGSLVPRLKERGFEAQHLVGYRALAADGLPANVTEKISTRKADGVLFFSTRTAAIFNHLVSGRGLAPQIKNMEAFCLSENVAEEAGKLDWKMRHTARTPTEQSMIDLLQAVRK